MKKWKNIKDKYRKALKQLKNIKSGTSATKVKKTYTYFNLLSFMRPVMEENPLEGNFPQEESYTESPNPVYVESPNPTQTDLENDVPNDNTSQITQPTLNRNQTKRKKQDQDQELLNILKERKSLEEVSG